MTTYADPTAKPQRYAGAPSFESIWRFAQERVARARREGFQRAPLPADATAYLYAAGAFSVAHPIAILPEQVKVLPPTTPAEAADYGYRARLPFDPVFLDFTDEDGRSLEIDGLAAVDHLRREDADPFDPFPVRVAGALITRHGLTRTDEESPEVLVVIPFAATARTHFEALGLFMATQDRCWPAGEGDFSDILQVVPGTLAFGAGLFQDDQPETRALVIPAVPVKASRNAALAMAGACVDAAERAIAVLYMLESVNVETVEATLHRRDRKRAEKRGWPIASTVFVRTPRRRAPARNGNAPGESRDYSHRFDRAGGYWHVTKGSHVRCRVCGGEEEREETCDRCKGTGLDPALVKPCIRRDESTGELTCPNGCRREWHPPTVVGDPDLPYVPKARRVKTV